MLGWLENHRLQKILADEYVSMAFFHIPIEWGPLKHMVSDISEISGGSLHESSWKGIHE